MYKYEKAAKKKAVAPKSNTPKKLVKSGPKSNARKENIDKTLKDLYYEDGITYSHAAEIAGCSPLYASLAFKQFGNEIAEHREKDEDWIDKNDRVRDRALEGLSRKINNSDNEIEKYQRRITEQKAIQLTILPNAAEKLTEKGGALAGIISDLNVKKMLRIYKLINSSLDMHRNYGYYVETIINNLRAEITLHAQLQQQYDTIEILPPAKEVLNAEIERRIAAKNNLLIQQPLLPVSVSDNLKEIGNPPKEREKN